MSVRVCVYVYVCAGERFIGLLGGDFNMSAQTLTASFWLSAIRAKVMHAPNDEATFVGNQGQGSAIDYFVVSNCPVASVEKVWVEQGPTCIRGH